MSKKKTKEPTIDEKMADVKEELVSLEKASWNGKYVKLQKGLDVKVQDNPERVKQLQKLGWEVVK
jgi:hypothetical protein